MFKARKKIRHCDRIRRSKALSRGLSAAGGKGRSLEDQQEHGHDVIGEIYEEKETVEYVKIASKAKGDLLNRQEIREIEKLIRSQRLDIFFAEDLGRIIRGTEAVRIVELCVDHRVRVICPNDCIDSNEETWE